MYSYSFHCVHVMIKVICIVYPKGVVKTEEGSIVQSKGELSLIEHSLNNGTVLPMENRLLRNALMVDGFLY